MHRYSQHVTQTNQSEHSILSTGSVNDDDLVVVHVPESLFVSVEHHKCPVVKRHEHVRLHV